MTIDLRSDTVTKPTAEMLEVMFRARVGDNVFAEDPSVEELENKIAKLFSHEAALFCPSGTMTNQIAIKVHTQPGDELLCDANSHIYNYEGGGISFNSGVQAKLLQGDRGRIHAAQITDNINPNHDWLTKTSLVCVENTVNRSGGTVYNFSTLQELSSTCKQHQLKYHMDGARIFNALNVTNDSPQVVGKLFDSISVCFSKGLGAPVGSALIGSKEFIDKARRIRKVFGGGMRQSGYLAAACSYALDNHVQRLSDDHQRAKELENILLSLPYVKSCMPVETNILIFTLHDSISGDSFVKQCAAKGLMCTAFAKQNIRFVTHLDFTDAMLEEAKLILTSIK
jgi:threonine aldolase